MTARSFYTRRAFPSLRAMLVSFPTPWFWVWVWVCPSSSRACKATAKQVTRPSTAPGPGCDAPPLRLRSTFCAVVYWAAMEQTQLASSQKIRTLHLDFRILECLRQCVIPQRCHATSRRNRFHIMPMSWTRDVLPIGHHSTSGKDCSAAIRHERRVAKRGPSRRACHGSGICSRRVVQQTVYCS